MLKKYVIVKTIEIKFLFIMKICSLLHANDKWQWWHINLYNFVFNFEYWRKISLKHSQQKPNLKGLLNLTIHINLLPA